jgi:hypothetical protein
VALWIATVILSVVSLKLSLCTNKSLKRVDIAMECQRRFAKVYYTLRPKAKANQYNVAEYYSLFWSLQIDQFQYWTEGLIDEKIFSFWMFCRHEEWLENEMIATMDYHSGWRLAVKKFRLESSEMYPFMMSVFEGTSELIENYR